jgi:Protein of unknown function (DUF3300)
MTKKIMKPFPSIVACLTLLAVGASTKAVGQTEQSSPTTGAASAPAVASQTPTQLDALVAPIALYPDALVAQVLAASTYPDQVAFADDWLAQNGSLQGKNLADAVNQQAWDPSVKALTQFPSVLHDLARNLAWTSSLGEAFTNQQADVMAAVQTMRQQAMAAGNLKSSSQITVVQQTPSTIVIQPTNPDVVYVPAYNPMLIYGTPYVIPMYTPPVAIVTPGIFWGSGIGIGGGWGWGWGGFGWGWNSWRCSWGGGGNIIYNNNIYINRTTNTFNNYHPWGPGTPGQGPGGFGPGNGGYHPTGGTTPIGPARPGGLNPPGSGGGYHPTGGGMNPISPADPGRPSSPGNYHPMGGGGMTPGNVPSRPGNYHPSGGFSPSHNYNPTYGNPQRGAYGNGFGRNNAMGASQQRSYMSGNGFNDRATSARGWGSMRGGGMPRMNAPRMSAPRSFGGRR